MSLSRSIAVLVAGGLMTVGCGVLAAAETSVRETRVAGSLWAPQLGISAANARPLAHAARDNEPADRMLAQAGSRAEGADTDAGGEDKQRIGLMEETVEREGSTESSGYLEISDFFNIREANANVSKGEWEVEFEAEWTTGAGEGDDDFAIWPNVKYGITDTLFIELEVLPLNLGDGGDQGNGDLALIVFNQFLKEGAYIPAFAAWAEMRIPTGQGSSGVDGELHFNVTKTLFPKFRAHLEGFIETANGGRGDEDENRRPFQWGAGPGFDYQFDEKTIGVLNYLNRSSEERGGHNQNILEIGVAREIVKGQHIKVAVDVGLDGQEETPDFGAKLLWSIEW